jgi:Tfp pilus assembly PilM family ATPase
VVQGRAVAYRRVPFADGPPRDAESLATAIKQALSSFLGRARRADIWVAHPLANLQVRHFTIPCVPARQVSNAVYRSLRKDAPTWEKDVVFDYAIEGDAVEEGARKMAVTAYAVDRRLVGHLRSAFEQAGFGLAGITLPLFALRNLFTTGWMPVPDGATVCLHTGEDESDITVFSGRSVATTCGIKPGARALADLVAHETAGRVTAERARELILGLARESGAESARREGDPTADEIMRMIEPGLARLARQIEQTIAAQLRCGIKDVRRICVSGRPWLAPAVREFMEREMGMAMDLIDPLASQPAARGLSVVTAEDETPLFAVAMGLALSSAGRTPNLLYTHKEKERDEGVRRLNTGIFAAFVVGMAALMGAFLWQGLGVARARWHQSAVEAKISALNPWLDRACRQLAQLKKAARDHVIVAVIGEVAALTPGSVRLRSVAVTAADPIDQGAGAPAAVSGDPAAAATLAIEGVVTGPAAWQGAWLARYVLDLEESAVLSGVRLIRETPAPKTGEDGVTTFSLTADVKLAR